MSALAVPATVIGAAVDRYLDTRITLPNSRATSPAGTVELGLLSRTVEPGMSFSFWPAGSDPEIDPPVLVHAADAVPSVSLDGRTMRATFPLERLDGEGATPAGEAVIVAELVADGDPVVIDEARISGNRRVLLAGWEQAILAHGEVTLPDGSRIPFEGVSGTLGLVDTFATNPDSFVERSRYSDVSTAIEASDAVYVVMGQLGEYWGWVQVARLPFDPEEAPLIGGYYIGDVDPMAFSLVIPVAPFDEGPPVANAVLDVSYREVGRPATWWTLLADVKVKVVEQPLAVEGSITFSGEDPVDLGGLEATFVDRQLVSTDPDGGRSGGPAPVNDLAEDAVDLAVGGTVRNVWTGGAAPEGEHEFPGTIAHTVWYRMTGTGGAVVLDTDASDYDTKLIVYQVVDGQLVEVAWADDQAPGRTPAAPDFQARLVLDTESGAEYLVQAGSAGTEYRGGAPAEFGRLFMTVTPVS
jgi:hypothetical protein